MYVRMLRALALLSLPGILLAQSVEMTFHDEQGRLWVNSVVIADGKSLTTDGNGQATLPLQKNAGYKIAIELKRAACDPYHTTATVSEQHTAVVTVPKCQAAPPPVKPKPTAPVRPTRPSPPPQPVIENFTVEPASIVAGQSATLHWQVTSSTDESIEQGVGAVSSVVTRAVVPDKSTTYTLAAGGSAKQSGSVPVAQAPPKQTKIVPIDLTKPPPELPANTPLLIRIPLESPPTKMLDVRYFIPYLRDAGAGVDIPTKFETTQSYFEVRVPPLTPGAVLDLRLSFEGHLSKQYIDSLAKSVDDTRFMEAVKWALEGQFPDLERYEKTRTNGLLRVALSALLASAPKEYWIAFGLRDDLAYNSGSSIDGKDFLVFSTDEDNVNSVVAIWRRLMETIR